MGGTKDIWLRIGERGKADVVQKGWMCQVRGIVDTEVHLAVRFELDVKGDAACTHLYAGQVHAFGIPYGLGVLQKQGEKQGAPKKRYMQSCRNHAVPEDQDTDTDADTDVERLLDTVADVLAAGKAAEQRDEAMSRRLHTLLVTMTLTMMWNVTR